MKARTIILTLLVAVFCLPLRGQDTTGVRRAAGQTFLRPLQERDSVLIADQLRYGVLLHDIREGTPLFLPEIVPSEDSPMLVLSSWQLDSVRISARKEAPARYDIRASILITAFMGGVYQLPQIDVVVYSDTLEFSPQTLVVTEPYIDMETFVPNDIKPQIRVPYTLKEVMPWLMLFWVCSHLLAWLICMLLDRRSRGKDGPGRELAQEPPHIRALRKLDSYRGEKNWAPEHQKEFYSGVTDALREYIAARYGIGAMEMTTAEIFSTLKCDDAPEDMMRSLEELFRRADFVKFAKYTASEGENAAVLPLAVSFVTTTYQSSLAEERKEEE